MNLFDGIRYNLKGLRLGLKTPKLMALGLVRFALVLLMTVFAVSLLLMYHQEIVNRIWLKPQSAWLVWLWYLFSWLVTLLLVGLSVILAYLVAQLLFSVVIMDLMSRITEKMITGREEKPPDMSVFRYFMFLVRQEIPRAVLPMILLMILVILGWLTPVGPLLAIVSAGLSAVFLAWDNTDLLFARRLVPLRRRLGYLAGNLLFHLGFGLWFLVPGLNLLMLSFAPVGATLYQIELQQKE
jgi:CysZ protein